MIQKDRNVIEGGPLYYNASQQLKYAQQMRKLVRNMSRDVKKQVAKIEKEPEKNQNNSFWELFGVGGLLVTKYDKAFARKSESLSKNMLAQSKKSSENAVQRSVGQMAKGLKLNADAFNDLPEDVANAIIKENVSLIRSIPKKYFDQIRSAVKKSIVEKQKITDLASIVTKYNGITMRRATNLALDQTRKAYTAANKFTMQKAGLTKFRWLHTGRSKEPRPSHVRMSGNIYSFDDLPIINKDNPSESPRRGLPGEAINCTCIMAPAIELGEN